MKTRISWRWMTGLALAVMPLVVGCAQSSASADTATAAVTNAAVPQPVAPPAATDTNAAPPLELANDISTAPAKPITTEPVPPLALQSNLPVMDVVKLANSRVDEGVMLAYVTNSPGFFSLGADEIIYLKDIGVPDQVIKSMIFRDQELKAQGLAPAVAPAGPTYQWAQAPNTNTAPQPEPAPSEVAPQYEGAPPAPQTAQPAPTAPASVTYSTFNDTLSPYGTWIEVEGYGRVWQPTVVVVNPSWRPYFDSGRWVYTDQGWYWLSDYSWGWAPFHYGRWFSHHRYGWCWAPDLVWGPSWVTWRYNNAYCGWAPLPPAACYYPGYGFYYYGSSVSIGFGWGLGYSSWCFVGYNHFQHHGLHAYRVPDHHARPIYDSTTPVNRIVNQNNLVANRGVPPEQVTAATRQEVRRVSLRDMRPTGVGPRERFASSGRELEVYRPTAQVRPDDPGIVQRSRREIPRTGGGALSAPSAPSAPSAERAELAESAGSAQRAGLPRPSPNANSFGSRGGTPPEVAPPVSQSQPGNTVGAQSTRRDPPSKPAVEASRPTAPNAQASTPNPATISRPAGATPTGAKPQAGQPIVMRGSQASRTPSIERPPVPAVQSTPNIERPTQRPTVPSRPDVASSSPSPAGRPNAPVTPPTSVPRTQTRPQNSTPTPAPAWQRTETPRPVTPTPVTPTTRSVQQAPQQRWSTPAPAPATPRVERPQPVARYEAPAVQRAPAYNPPARPAEVPRAATAYQPPSRAVEAPRAAPAPAPQPAYRAPAPSAPSAPAPSAPVNRGQNNGGGGNPRGNR